METPNNHQRENEEPEYNPITISDILRAVFMPEEEAQEIGFSFPQVDLKSLPIPRISQASESAITLPEDDRPTRIIYQDAGIASQATTTESISSAQMLTVGLGTVITFLLAYLGQLLVAHRANFPAGMILYVVSIFFWVGVLAYGYASSDLDLISGGPSIEGTGTLRPPKTLTIRKINTRLAIGIAGLGFTVLTFILSGDNTFRPTGILTWAISVILMLFALSERDILELGQDFVDWMKTIDRNVKNIPRPHLGVIGVMVAILIAGVFFRFTQMENIPPEMTSDHIEKILDANRISQGTYNIFMRNNGGRESLHFYFVAWLGTFLGTGMSFTTLKIASAIESILLLPLMWMLGKEVLNRQSGLFSAGLVAISWWHVILGRLSLRIVLTPLVFTLVLITLIRGMRTGSRKSWLWVGIWLGVGVYSYQAMRIAPFAVVFAFLLLIIGPLLRALRTRQESDSYSVEWLRLSRIASRQGLNLLGAGIISFTIFVPMMRVWWDYPEDLWRRVLTRTTESEKTIQGENWQVLWDNMGDALQMYNIQGDVSWFTAIPGEPFLDNITAVLFILGLVAWAVRLAIRRDPVDFLLVATLIIMTLPSALALAFPLENPSNTRASGVIPAVFVIAGWPLSLIWDRWRAVFGRSAGRALAGTFVGILFVGAGLTNYQLVFHTYVDSYRKSSPNPGEIADAISNVIGEDGSTDSVWIQSWPFWQDHRAIGLELGDITFSQTILNVPHLETLLAESPEEFNIRPLVFVVKPEDEEALSILANEFPSGEARFFESQTYGKDFILFVVEQ